MLDDAVRRRENRAGGAVVLLKADFPHIGEVLLEVHDVLVVRAAPAVNRLVVVAHDGNIPVGQQVHELVLLVARVLELVHHDVLVAALVLGENVGTLLEEPYRERDEVVEIDGVEEPQPLLVAVVQLPVHRIFGVPRLAPGLYVGEEDSDFVDVKSLGAVAKFATGLLDERIPVGLVVD